MKKAIVNLSTLKFKVGQDRLYETAKANSDADLLFFTNEMQVGAPKHVNNKYAFKPFAIERTRQLGYDVVLWLDASMFVRRDLSPLFEEIERTGYFWQDSGWHTERWTTEAQAEYFGTCHGVMISAGVVGLDFRTEAANRVLDKWLRAAKDGAFHGSHDVTRHDQTCLSLIIEKMGLEIADEGTFWAYGKPDGEYVDNILILADGIC